jgi:hypothetical protein
LASAVSLAVAMALVYRHGQSREYTTTWTRSNSAFGQRTEVTAPTLAGALDAAVVPLIVSGVLLLAASGCAVASRLARPPSSDSVAEQITVLWDRSHFLGQMVASYGILLAVSVCWLFWACGVLLFGERKSSDFLASATSVPEPEALLAPLVVVGVALPAFVVTLVCRKRTVRALNKLTPSKSPPKKKPTFGRF